MTSGDQTKERIEREALHLFLTRGYEGTPVRLIAKAANVTTPALYWHYKSKDDIAYTILTRLHQLFESTILDAIDGGSPEDQLRAYVSAYVKLQLRERRGPAKIGFHQLAAALPEEQRSELFAMQRPALERLRKILRDGATDGSFEILDATATALAINSMCDYVFTWFRPGDEPDVDHLAECYSDMAVRLASGRRTSPLELNSDRT